MRNVVFCVSKKGPALPLDASQALARIGVEMAKKNQRSVVVDEPAVAGQITTELVAGCISTIHGLFFSADVATRNGQIKLTYIVEVTGLVAEEMQAAWQVMHAGPSPSKYAN